KDIRSPATAPYATVFLRPQQPHQVIQRRRTFEPHLIGSHEPPQPQNTSAHLRTGDITTVPKHNKDSTRENTNLPTPPHPRRGNRGKSSRPSCCRLSRRAISLY